MSLNFKFITLFIVGVLFGFSTLGQTDAVRRGKVLAESYCGSCHAFPEPSLLPKKIWKKNVLPQMAAFMGIKVAQDNLEVWDKTEEEIAILKKLGVYPSTPLLVTKDFQAIVAYYETEAPVELPVQKTKAMPIPLEDFTTKKLFIEGLQSPKTSLVAINEERSEVFIADATTNQLFVKAQNDELYTLPNTSSPAVDYIIKAPNVFTFITIGSIAPSDLSQGSIYEMNLNTDGWNVETDMLARPVYGMWEDIENDGKPDFLLCNYGNNGGNISIYMDGDFESTPTLLGGSGARKLELVDLNHDGKLDIVALFCQGNERLSVFYSKANGQFESEKVLIRFSPVMGSSYFEMQDMNGDGEIDLLMSNGDNWDYSSVLKPYHGFRIYENLGDGVFKESWFYPQFGAAKVMAVDLDDDGDLDLATIAFYDELENPAHQFLLFENTGNLTFQPKYISEAAMGKWMTMDVGDIDADGDEDIVLGAYAHNALEYTKLAIRGVNEFPSVLILESQLK